MSQNASRVPTTIDLERGAYNDGYPALARFMAQDPDSETLIFRKFESLAVRNLLYLQAELFVLKKEIHDFESTRVKGDVDLMVSMRRWESYAAHAEGPEQRPEKEMEHLRIRLKEKLKEYHEALLLQADIANLGLPRKRALNLFRRWFEGDNRKRTNGKPARIIDGTASKMLDDRYDLVGLKIPEDDDRLTRLLRDYWPFREKSGDVLKEDDDTRYFHARHVTRTVAIVSTMIAALELVGAITSLYFVQGRHARISLIALFTSLFGFSLCLLTNAKRSEIYGASAAYAAVLVVFVSGDLASPGVASSQRS